MPAKKLKREQTKCRKCGLNLFTHSMFHNGDYVELKRCVNVHAVVRRRGYKAAYGSKEYFPILFSRLFPKGFPFPGDGNRSTVS